MRLLIAGCSSSSYPLDFFRTYSLSHNHILTWLHGKKVSSSERTPFAAHFFPLISPLIALIYCISQVFGWDACLTVASADLMKRVFGATLPIKMRSRVIRHLRPAGVPLTGAQTSIRIIFRDNLL